MNASRPSALFTAAAISLAFAPSAPAQFTWTGLAAPDNLWTTPGNWTTGVPDNSHYATFNNAGNGNTTVSLGGATRSIAGISFDTSATAAYTIGVLGSSDALAISGFGAVSVNSTVTTAQTINAVVLTGGALFVGNYSAIQNGLTLAGGVSLGITMGVGGGDTMSVGGGTGGVAITGPITFSAAGSRRISNGLPTGGTLTLGSAAAPSTITIGAGSQLVFSGADNGQSTVVNDAIVGAGSLSILGHNPVTLAGQSTFSGGTMLTSAPLIPAPTVLVGSSSNSPPGNFTAGPFGTGPVAINDPDQNVTTIVPIGQAQMVANPVTASSNVQIRGTVPLTLTGTFTVGSARPTVEVVIGETTSALTLAGNVYLSDTAGSGQTLIVRGNGGTLIYGGTLISGVIADFNGPGGSPGRLTVTGTAAVRVTAANTYSGGTSVTGPSLLVDNTTGSGTGSGAVTVTGFGASGTGGVLGGSGTVAGLVTISSTTASSRGGIISPGGNGAATATLTVGPTVWDPLGRYDFNFNAADSTVGGGVNDLIRGTAGLDLSSLNSSNRFGISLAEVATAPVTTPRTFTLAMLLTGITGAGGVAAASFADGTDVTGLFTVTDLNSGVESALIRVSGPAGGPQSLTATITPVPEPGTFALAAVALPLVARWWHRR